MRIVLNETIKFQIVILPTVYTASGTFSIIDADWDWADSVIDAKMPLIWLMHPAPHVHLIRDRTIGTQNTYWDRIKVHSNTLIVFYAHDQQGSYHQIWKGTGENPIHLMSSYVSGYGANPAFDPIVFDVFTDKITFYSFRPYENEKYTHKDDASSGVIYYDGIQALNSGRLVFSEVSKRWTESTEAYYSIPYSYKNIYASHGYLRYPARLTEYWLSFKVRFLSGTSWQFCPRQYKSPNSWDIIRSFYNQTDSKFYPNFTGYAGITVSTTKFYSLTYFINETSQITDVYLYDLDGTKMGEWQDIPFISWSTLTGEYEMFLFARSGFAAKGYYYIDDFIVTYSKTVTQPSNSKITLQNGTEITDTTIDLLSATGQLWLRNATVTIGDSTRKAEIFGGDELGVYNLSDLWMPTHVYRVDVVLAGIISAATGALISWYYRRKKKKREVKV